MTIHELDTPALTIDLDILEKNIDTVFAVRNGWVEETWKVTGRGRVQ